jgi:hypothetical protein
VEKNSSFFYFNAAPAAVQIPIPVLKKDYEAPDWQHYFFLTFTLNQKNAGCVGNNVENYISRAWF